MTHEYRLTTKSNDEHDKEDLAKQEPANASDCHDAPPEHGRDLVTRVLLGRQGVKYEHVAEDKEDDGNEAEGLSDAKSGA